MKVLGVLIALLLLLPSTVLAAKPVASGSLSLDTAQSDLRYQGVVRFLWDAKGYKGFEYPMILVACSQSDNPYRYTSIDAHPSWVYAQLAHPYDGFVLGGGSSAWVRWVNENPTDAVRKTASCEATLYIYPNPLSGHNVITELDRIVFNVS